MQANLYLLGALRLAGGFALALWFILVAHATSWSSQLTIICAGSGVVQVELSVKVRVDWSCAGDASAKWKVYAVCLGTQAQTTMVYRDATQRLNGWARSSDDRPTPSSLAAAPCVTSPFDKPRSNHLSVTRRVVSCSSTSSPIFVHVVLSSRLLSSLSLSILCIPLERPF